MGEVVGSARAELREKGSRFLALLLPVDGEAAGPDRKATMPILTVPWASAAIGASAAAASAQAASCLTGLIDSSSKDVEIMVQ